MSIMDEIKRRAAQGNLKYNWEDLQQLRKDDEAKQFDHFKNQIENCRTEQVVGRSGILPLHMGCTVANFEVKTEEQREAKEFATKYISEFSQNQGSGFIFSGTPGTGKNHLAAAICNALMESNYTCLVITVNELMQKLRNCYKSGSETTEDKFIRTMIDYDLLVIDEIGLQRGTDSENLALNQIVDQRICRFKPTGMLTNLDAKSINECLGVRVMDRMRMNGGKWIPFNWESYRK